MGCHSEIEVLPFADRN